MVLEFLFGKKKNKQEETKKEVKKETKKASSLEQEMEKSLSSLPSTFRKQIEQNPSIKEKLIAIAKRMKAEGVDLNSVSAIKKWVKEHKKELQQEQQGKVETIVKEKEPGRNDPCPCGSGKKYKKCCGANK